MTRIWYFKKCRCKNLKLKTDELSISQNFYKTIKKKKKRKPKLREYQPKIFYDIVSNSLDLSQESPRECQIFTIKYNKNLSPTAIFILNSFKNKYIYYALDDIIYGLKSDPIEKNRLLLILNSAIISLQNHFSINFFDIWIKEISIKKLFKTNKFIANKNFEQFNLITIKLVYQHGIPAKKPEILW
uniref:Hypothetical chloroplast RF88 n=1 Tax=Climaconeis sp. TaxID=2846830 RepID=A0A8F8X814_9STRA|nr:hypothetical chloroplast RF88 [Climaconeis sp.]